MLKEGEWLSSTAIYLAVALLAHAMNHIYHSFRYRLKLCLFETIGNQVHHCKSIYSDPFMVYTAKRFPGMEGELQSTVGLMTVPT